MENGEGGNVRGREGGREGGRKKDERKHGLLASFPDPALRLHKLLSSAVSCYYSKLLKCHVSF